MGDLVRCSCKIPPFNPIEPPSQGCLPILRAMHPPHCAATANTNGLWVTVRLLYCMRTIRCLTLQHPYIVCSTPFPQPHSHRSLSPLFPQNCREYATDWLPVFRLFRHTTLQYRHAKQKHCWIPFLPKTHQESHVKFLYILSVVRH